MMEGKVGNWSEGVGEVRSNNRRGNQGGNVEVSVRKGKQEK